MPFGYIPHGRSFLWSVRFSHPPCCRTIRMGCRACSIRDEGMSWQQSRVRCVHSQLQTDHEEEGLYPPPMVAPCHGASCRGRRSQSPSLSSSLRYSR